MSVLSTLAAGMAVGDWALLANQASGIGIDWTNKEEGYNSGISQPVGGFGGYSSRGFWDSQNKKVWRVAAPHFQGTPPFKTTYSIYDEASHTVQYYHFDDGVGEGHTYDAHCGSVAHRKLYFSLHHRGGAGGDWRGLMFDLDNPGSLTPSPIPNASMGDDSEPSMEVFVSRDEMYRLQYGDLKKINLTTFSSWQTVPGWTVDFAQHGIAGGMIRYSPQADRLMVIGGATSNYPIYNPINPPVVHHIKNDGTVVRMGNGPSAIAIMTDLVQCGVDPASGKIIFLQNTLTIPASGWTHGNTNLSGFTLWSYDIANDLPFATQATSAAWTQLSTSNFPSPSLWWDQDYLYNIHTIPVDTHGVILFWGASAGSTSGSTHSSSQTSIYALKVAATAPPVTSKLALTLR